MKEICIYYKGAPAHAYLRPPTAMAAEGEEKGSRKAAFLRASAPIEIPLISRVSAAPVAHYANTPFFHGRPTVKVAAAAEAASERIKSLLAVTRI